MAWAGSSVRKNRVTRPAIEDGMPVSRNSHCQPARWATPLRSFRIQVQSGPATTPESGMALEKMATIRTRCFSVYQNVRYRITPGKKPDSTAPSRKRRMQ